MSIIGEALTKWLGRYNKPSVMCQGTVCEQIPEGTKSAMINISEDSTEKNKEMGAAIRSGYELGPVTTGSETRVPIIRTPDTIGSFHTHPNGWPTPSTYDLMEAMARGDKVTCLGATDRWGTKIACYTPVDPMWSEYKNRMVSLLQDIRNFNQLVSGKYKARKVPLKRLLKYIADPDYLQYVKDIRPPDMTIIMVDAANKLERAKRFANILRVTEEKAEWAKKELDKAEIDFNIAIDTGDVNEIRETQIELDNARKESRRLDAQIGIERRLTDDAETEAEIARIKAQVTPGDLEQGRKNADDALKVLSEGAKLEIRRQQLVDQVDTEIRYSGYKPEWRPAPLAIDKCHLIWETGLPEEMPYEL